jgi:hypothetical protein
VVHDAGVLVASRTLWAPPTARPRGVDPAPTDTF